MIKTHKKILLSLAGADKKIYFQKNFYTWKNELSSLKNSGLSGTQNE